MIYLTGYVMWIAFTVSNHPPPPPQTLEMKIWLSNANNKLSTYFSPEHGSEDMEVLSDDIVLITSVSTQSATEIILGMGSPNERRRYIVTSSLSSWVNTHNDPCANSGPTVGRRRTSSTLLPYAVLRLLVTRFAVNARYKWPMFTVFHQMNIILPTTVP